MSRSFSYGGDLKELRIVGTGVEIALLALRVGYFKAGAGVLIEGPPDWLLAVEGASSAGFAAETITLPPAPTGDEEVSRTPIKVTLFLPPKNLRIVVDIPVRSTATNFMS